MKSNCSCGCGGTCGSKLHRLHGNLLASEVTRINYEGEPYVVVPVVMARDGVVMNGALTEIAEFLPESWNGVPVTVGHPTSDGNFMSANTPENLTKWHVGRIFNARIEDNALKAEAWINVARATEVAPELMAMISGGQNMDVSTGYFCFDVEQNGVSQGESYEYVSRDIKPDHLALLPNEEGACSWEDGCGVRANRGKASMKLKQRLNQAVGAILTAVGVKEGDSKAADLRKKVANALEKAFTSNERGEPDDVRQMRADLISSEDSPFTPDDEGALAMMTEATLKKMRDTYLPNAEGDEPNDTGDNEPDPTDPQEPQEEANAEGDPEDKQDPPAANRRHKKESTVTMNAKDLTALIAAEVKKATASLISNEDRAAIARANRLVADEKKKLVAHIVAHSAITEANANKMDIATLEVVAAGIQPAANYGGRAMPDFATNDADQDYLRGMIPPSTRDIIVANRKKGAH